jgi:hypothetical protein
VSDTESPDTELVLRTWLSTLTTVVAITSTRIGLMLTDLEPAIRYALLGGGYVGGGAVWAQYQVELWGAGDGNQDDGTADSLARKILAATPTFTGWIGGATVSGASASYPYAMNDPTTNRPRRIIQLTFTATP